MTAVSPLLIGLTLAAFHGRLAAASRPAAHAIVSSASFQPTVAPGSLASLFGTDLSPATYVGELDSEGNLPTELGGVSVTVGGQAAQLLFVSPTQINLLVPATVTLGRMPVVITRQDSEGGGSSQLAIQVDQLAPAIFQAGLLHPDRAAAINAVTFEAGPIVSGEDETYVSLFGTGLRGAGEVAVQLIDRTGNITEVVALYTGPAPGFVGLDQVNFAVPSALGAAGVLEVRLRMGGLFSNVVSLDLTAMPGAGYLPGELLMRAFAGTGLRGYDGDGGAATRALLQGPRDVELAADGSLLIADADNRVIRRVSPSGQITTFAGTGEDGSDGDGGPAVQASFRLPISLAADALGNVYVADAGAHRVRRINRNGIITTLAGVGVEGFGGDGGPASSALLSSPADVAVNAQGSVLIADTGNHRIRLVTADGMIQTIAGSGAPGNTGDGGPAVSATLNGPTSLAVTSLNTIFFSDGGNRRIRRIDATGVLHGVLSMAQEGEPAAGKSVSIALDPSEQLVLSDAGLHRLSVLRLNALVQPVAGQDQPGPLGDGGPAIEAELWSPSGSAVNPFGDILLADALNHKVRLLWRHLGDEDAACGQVAQVVFVPGVVIGGERAVGYVRLNCPTDADVTILLSSDSPGVPAPASVAIPAGGLFGVFILQTPAVEDRTVVTVTATGGGGTSAGALTILPGGGPGIRGLSVAADSVIGGQTTVGRILLGSPAPAGGLLVELSSSHSQATTAASVLIPEGAISAEFLIGTSKVDKPLLVVLTGATGEISASAPLLILPSGGDGGEDAHQLVSLVVDPSVVLGAASVTATVTADKPAPAGGLEVFISASTPLLTAPPTVTIPEGETSVSFQVQTAAPEARVIATLLATRNNTVRATLTINVESGPGAAEILSLSLAPASVTGGESSTGTVQLAAPAPAGGALVSLTSGNPAASTPQSVLIAAGQTTAEFVVNTTPVGSTQTAQITATSANTVSATLSISPSSATLGEIAGLTLSPSTVTGGQTSTGTVTLAAAAPSGGVLVNLSSGDPNATTPAAIVVPEGQTQAQFTIATQPVVSQTAATITATSSNSRSATLTLQAPPAGQGQLGGLTLTPVSVIGGQSSAGVVHLTTAAPAGGVVVTLSSDNPNAQVPASIVIPAGATSGAFTATTNAVGASQAAQITATSANSVGATLTINPATGGQGQISGLSLNPASVNGGQSSTGTVTLANAAPAGGVLVNLSSGNANATTPASLVIPEGQTAGQFTVTTSPVGSQQSAQITATSANAVNATLTINQTPPGQGQISGLSLNPTTVNGGEPSTGTVTLAAAAPIGGVLVHLSSNTPHAVTPASIVIAAGQTAGQFPVTTSPVASEQAALITATSANSVNATLTLKATPAGFGQLSGVSLSPTAVNGGQSSTGTVTLAEPAPTGGVLVNLASGNPNATTPASIVIPAGQSSGQFTVTTSPVATQQSALITASSANTVSATLTINQTPAGQGQISGLSLNPTTVTGGQSSTGTVTLANAAPTGGVLVNLSSGNANATTPASIVIPAGQGSGQFTVTTAVVGAPQTAAITATSANSVNATLTIDPPLYCVNSLVLNVAITDLLSGSGVLTSTVTLDGPAPQGGTQVELVRSGATIGTVLVPEGQVTGSVDLAIANLLTLVGSTVQAVLNGCPAVHATITLGSPVTGEIAGVSLNPSTVFAGQAVTGSVTLVAAAGSNGVLVSLSTNNPSATILPSSVVVPAGQTSTTFPVNTVNTSASPVVATITATSAASSKSADLTINSSNPCVEGFQLTANITNLASGAGVLNALVTLTGPAPAGGANVPLLIGSTQIGQVAIPANQSTGLAEITVANLPTLLGSVVQAVFGPCPGVNATIALNAPILGNLTIPASLTLGQSAIGVVTLSSPAPAGGATVVLDKNALGLVGDLLNALLGAVVIPSSVVVPEGQTETTFNISSSVIGGLLGLLLPSSTDLQIDATLQSAFNGNTLTKILQCLK